MADYSTVLHHKNPVITEIAPPPRDASWRASGAPNGTDDYALQAAQLSDRKQVFPSYSTYP